jgi:hypothetical protein
MSNPRRRHPAASLVLLFYRAFHLLHRGIQVVVEGILLGLQPDAVADEVTEESYGSGAAYTKRSYLDSGLQFWEHLAVEKYFRPGSRVLVAAAGGGREVIALARAGFTAEGFDCSRAMVAAGNAALRERGISGNLLWAPPCQVPPLEGRYGGAIVGWNGYTYILPRARRIAFLKDLGTHLEPGSPVLISAAYGPKSLGAVWTPRIANAARRCTFREPVFEDGDAFPGRRRKEFLRGQIDAELAEAGFKLLDTYRWGPFFAVVCSS